MSRSPRRSTRVTFSGGVIRPGQFQDFGLSVGVPEGKPGSMLTFKAIQTYDDGEVGAGSARPTPMTPAPQVELTAAEGEEAAPRRPLSSPSAPAASEEDDDGNGLAIAALVVGGLGLIAGLAALVMTRRRPRVGAA